MGQAGDDLEEMERNGTLSDLDKQTIQTWGQTVAEHGPEVLRKPGAPWRDHELKAEWAGHRSSCYSTSGRIIYRIEDRVVRVVVVRITATHDYEKGKKK